MGLNCGCPAGAHLEDLTIPDCKESLGQIQKVLIQRVYKTAGTLNTIADPETKASWTALLSAADGTKVIVSPYIQGPTTEPGAARTWGSGNEVLGGVPKVIGREPTGFLGNIYEEAQSVIKVLKSYQCENIAVYLIDEYGNIGCLEAGSNACKGIPVQGFFVGDKNLGGLEAVDGNAISWNFMPNWSDDLVIIKPEDFNPLTDLANAASAGA